MGILFQNKPLPEPFTIYVQDFDFERYLAYANEDIDCELINGVLVIHSPASLEHELIFKFLLNLLDLYVQQQKLGVIIGSRFTMNLSDKWGPEPDIMFIDETQEEKLRDTYLEGPATVVIEILSPSTRDDDLEKKIPYYIESGVKEAWIIDPKEQTVTIQWHSRKKEAASVEWAESKFIPGFRLHPSWLWNVKNISVIEKLNEIMHD